MKLKYITLFSFILLSFSILAQTKYTIKGNEAYEKGYWSSAISNYQISLKKEKDKELKINLMFNMARSYENLRDYPNAINWYTKVTKEGGPFVDQHPEVYLYLGDSYKKMEKYEEAIDNYKTFADLKPEDKRGINGQKSSELALEWIANPTRYKVENLRDLNSENDDAAPTYSSRKKDEIIFQSYRSGTVGRGENDVNGQPFPDLFTAKLDKNGTWSKPTALEGEVNSEFAEGSPSMDSRNSTIYFSRCISDKKNITGCDILYAKRQGKGFSEALALEFFPDSVSMVVVHPALSPDDQVIYFASNHKDGYGGFDLYYAVWNKKEKRYDDAVNLGPEINTPGDEFYPYIHEDGTLYFSSNGHIGLGGFDLFKVEKLDKGYGPVTNLKFPLNSPADDISIIFEGDKERGYITSNRAGGRGKTDIWSFVLPPLEIFVQGTICNAKTKEKLVNAKVVMNGSDGSLVEMMSDEMGGYRFELKPNTTYQIKASFDETWTNQFGTVKLKFFASDKALVDAIGVEDSKTFVQDICLNPIPKEGIRLPKILYEYNKATLLEESKLRLNGLIETMNNNPTLVIELGSHTDFRGSDSYNKSLAQKRAQSAVDYLISKGIAKDRMEAKGYGEEQPYTIDSLAALEIPDEFKTTLKKGVELTQAFIESLKDKDMIEYAHQLNRRTEFKVLRTDYKPATGKKEGE